MKWFTGPIILAEQVSKRNSALLIVFVDTNSDNGLQMNTLWDSVESSLFACPTVAVHIHEGDDSHKQFAQKFPTPILPASYIIDHSGRLIQIITLLTELDVTKFQDILKSVASSNGDAASHQPSTTIPSTSASSKATTEFEVNQEKIRIAKEKLEKKRKADEEKKRQEEKEKELERIQAGKMVLQAQQKQQEKELLDAAAERRKDKLAAEVDRARVKAQIQADREEREYRLRLANNTEPLVPVENTVPTDVKPVASDACRVQVRLPDGGSLVGEFPSLDQLQTLVAFIQNDGQVKGKFTLVTPYPRTVFSDDDYQKSFLELCLTPSCTLIVEQARRAAPPSSVISKLSSFPMLLATFVLLPLNFFWNTIASFLGIGNTGSNQGGDTANAGSSSGTTASAAQPRQRRVPRGADVRRRGNVSGLHNSNGDSSEPEENPNWNGNSTQFL